MSGAARSKSRRIAAARRRKRRFTAASAGLGLTEVTGAREGVFGLAQPVEPRQPREPRFVGGEGAAIAAEPEAFGRVARAGEGLERPLGNPEWFEMLTRERQFPLGFVAPGRDEQGS